MFIKCVFLCDLELWKHEAPLVGTTGGSVEQLLSDLKRIEKKSVFRGQEVDQTHSGQVEYFAFCFLYPRKLVATFQ